MSGAGWTAACSCILTIVAISSAEGPLPGSDEKASIVLALGDYESRKFTHQPTTSYEVRKYKNQPPLGVQVNRAPAPQPTQEQVASRSCDLQEAHKAAYEPYAYERTEQDYRGSQLIIKKSPH